MNYGYDDLCRLTSETVAADPGGRNGQVTYSYDSVGNRTQLSSTLAAVPPTGLLNYDANDRTATDSYDPNGNLTFNGQQNVYDFENRLVQRGGVTIVYDGDGNRVQETVAGVVTRYLTGEVNPTGYVQVLAELSNTNQILRGYMWGLQLAAVRDFTVNPGGIFHYYGLDGHGSVRFLTDATGAVTDTYDYDAFGNLIASTGTTVNNYLFAGEQFDPALGIYYNRARYYDQRQGRSWTMDTFEGIPGDPQSLHKYTYANNNPVRLIDPSGQASVEEEEEEEVLTVQMTNASQAILQPAVAGGAQTVAQAVVVTSQLQVALSTLLLTSLSVGPVVAALLPTDAPKKDDDKKRRTDNRGRLQVQGADIEDQKYDLSAHPDFKYKDDTVSWPWSQPMPLAALTAQSKLSEFLQTLTYAQIGRRGKAFADASRFIQNAALGGGIGPPGPPSFNARDPHVPDARVDIEVQAGIAFVP